MHTTPTLATRFASAHTRVLRSDTPLEEDWMRAAAPSIFAEGKHSSRSERYTYIPTIDILRGLRREGFEAFMAAQSKSRIEGKTEFTKHMIRLRHARDREGQLTNRPEANEIILINSHDGASSYQLLAGRFRFVCCNGLVVGDASHDIRIPHKGNIQHEVIEGAFRVLDDFEAVEQSADGMKALELKPEEERAFATAALALRYGERTGGQPPAPITVEQMTRGASTRGLGPQSLDVLPEGPGERDARRAAGSLGAGPSHADATGRQHRPQHEPEPRALAAGRGDAQAQDLTP